MLRPRRRGWAITGVAVAVAVAGTVVGVRLATDSSPPEPAVVVWGTSQPLPDNFLPVIDAGAAVSTAQLEARVLPGPFLLTPDLAVVHDEDLLTSEPHHRPGRWPAGGDLQLGPGGEVERRPSDKPMWTSSSLGGSSDTLDPARGGCPDLVSTTGYNQIRSVKGKDGGRTVEVTFSPPYADWKSLSTSSCSRPTSWTGQRRRRTAP